MTAKLDTADPQQTIAELRRQLDARTAELAARNSAYSERIAHQAAANDVLKMMSASPGDPQPVFDLIVERARDLCDGYGVTVYEFDGTLIHWRAATGVSEDPLARQALEAMYPMVPTREFPGGRAILDRQIVHIRDLEAEPGLSPSMRGLTVKSNVSVPLMRGDAAIGALILGSRARGDFTDSQVELLQTFAEQAVIAITSAETYRQLQQRTGDLQEALDQQTATAEVLRVINASPGDLGPVFEAILEKALRLSGGAFGNLLSYDGDLFKVEAALHHDGRIAEELRRRAPFRTIPGGTLSAMIDGQGVSFTANILEAPDYLAGHAEFRRMVDGGGYRSVLNVALRKEGTLFGTIGIFRTEVRPFTDKEIALLQNFAAQAVVAMENARLLDELRARTEEIAELNRGLEARVAAQVDELGRVGRLRRFLAPQLAELIVSQGDEKILESHRREIVVVFCDLRGYTAFTETAEPEEVLDFLREYHGALGPLVAQFEGTLDQFSGDGIMVFFNDPVPMPDPAERAVKMAMAMREAAASLIADWRERGRDLGFGAGIAQGYATLGQIGFSERAGYTAIGTVCNVAARLCAEAKDGQILLSQRVNAALKGSVTTEQMGALTLKGLTQPIAAYNLPLVNQHPALRVIEGGPESV